MAIDYLKEFSCDDSNTVSVEGDSLAKVTEVLTVDFGKFARDYTEVLKGQAMIDAAEGGVFNRDIISGFAEITENKYSVSFGYDTTGKHADYYVEFCAKSGDNPFRIIANETVKYGDTIIDNKSIIGLDINTLERISAYVKVVEMCANMTSDKIDAWAKEQRKRNGENE